MVCRFCNHNSAYGSKFCENCGAAFTDAELSAELNSQTQGMIDVSAPTPQNYGSTQQDNGGYTGGTSNQTAIIRMPMVSRTTTIRMLTVSRTATTRMPTVSRTATTRMPTVSRTVTTRTLTVSRTAIISTADTAMSTLCITQVTEARNTLVSARQYRFISETLSISTDVQHVRNTGLQCFSFS